MGPNIYSQGIWKTRVTASSPLNIGPPKMDAGSSPKHHGFQGRTCCLFLGVSEISTKNSIRRECSPITVTCMSIRLGLSHGWFISG